MPPLRNPGGRASKACEGCRKGKTRCYPSSSGSCLRCNTLRLQCSLQTEPADNAVLTQTLASAIHHDCAAVAERVSSLERVVQKLADTIGLDLESESVLGGTDELRHELQRATITDEAPLLLIRNAASETSNLRTGSPSPPTIIEKGFLSIDEVELLLDIFRSNYRRWIAPRENDDLTGSAFEIGDSPLLLSACCLIAVRHWNSERALQTVDLLFHEAKTLLSLQLLQAPQPVAFFQAVLVLSLWSSTVGQKPLSMDSWLMTGYAIQHSSTADAFKVVRYHSSLPAAPADTIGKLLLWTRICLAHLHACVSMRRTAMINKYDIERIRKQLPSTDLSNYEMRMVAELNLYWTIYENVIATPVHLPQAQAALQSWRHVWSFLFDQPRAQFIQMGFHFAQLLIFEQSLNNKSAAVRESLLSEMVRLCSAIPQIAMETTDDRTKHLTDHIYHLITFAAVTLCRLLCKYESQPQARIDLASCDMLIFNTARWLHTLGSPLHVGHTMGNVIDAVHRKLRPQMNSALRLETEPEYPTPEQTNFPGLLGIPTGMDSLDFDWSTIIPEWQSLELGDELAQPAQRPALN